jgi:hypothetical protein
MYFFNRFTLGIMSLYRTHLVMFDTILTGFTGTASERPPAAPTSEIDEDCLWFAAGVNFTNANALVRIKSISPQYEWMSNNDQTPIDTPIPAIAGTAAQVLPMLPLIQPFFTKANGRILHYFTNSASAPTTGGEWTWALLRLADPLDGKGWNYGMPIPAV